jgi:hypothetical protein
VINSQQSTEMLSNLSNWKTLRQLANENPQFTYSQLKRLFWLRDQHPGLSNCARLIGKRVYVNEPVFAMWLSGQLISVRGTDS